MRLARARLALFSLALLMAVSVSGQTILTLEDLVNLPGKNVSKGSNSTPVGQFGVKSYHLEELTLTAPVRVDGQTINVAKAYRLSITGGPFEVRSQAAVVALNGTPLRNAIEKDDLSEIVALTFDDSILKDGAAITLSYGEDTTELPEKLKGWAK